MGEGELANFSYAEGGKHPVCPRRWRLDLSKSPRHICIYKLHYLLGISGDVIPFQIMRGGGGGLENFAAPPLPGQILEKPQHKDKVHYGTKNVIVVPIFL